MDDDEFEALVGHMVETAKSNVLGLPGENLVRAINLIEQLKRATLESTDTVTNTLNALDVATGGLDVLALGGAGTLKVLSKVAPTTASRLVASKPLQNKAVQFLLGIKITDEAKNLETIITDRIDANPLNDIAVEEELVEALLPAAAKPEGIGIDASTLSGRAQENLRASEEALQELKRTRSAEVATDEITEDDVWAMVKENKEDIRGKVEGVSLYTTPEGDSRAVLMVGKRRGKGGYGTAKQAENAAIKREYQDYKILDQDGEWYIAIDKSVPNRGTIAPIDTGDSGKSILSRILGVNFWAPKAYYADKLASGRLQQKYTQLHAQLIKPFSSLKTKKMRRLLPLIESGRDFVGEGNEVGKWFTRAEANDFYRTRYGMDISDDELAAYEAYRKASDYNWSIDNGQTYLERTSRGLHTVKIGEFEYTGKQFDPTSTDSMKIAVYDVNKKNRQKLGGLSNQDMQRMMDEENYVFYRLEEGIEVAPKKFAKVIAVKQGDVKDLPLHPIQKGYVAGGSRPQASNYYVKQGRARLEKNAVEQDVVIVEDPRAFVGTLTKPEADAYAKAMEDVRIGYIAYKDGDMSLSELEDLLTKTNIEDLATLEKMVANQDFDLLQPFVAVGNNGLVPNPTMRSLGLADNAKPEFIEEFSGLPDNVLLETTYNKPKQGKRGSTRLLNPNNEAAEVLDPYNTVQRGLNEAAKLKAFGSMQLKWQEKWLENAKKYAEGNTNAANKYKSTSSQFLEFKLKDPAKVNKEERQAIQQLVNLRDDIKRSMGLQSTDERMAQALKVGLLESIGTLDNKLFGRPTAISRKAYGWMDSSILGGMRSIAFHTKLGALGIHQLLLQTSTAAVSIGVSPKYGMKAVRMLYPFQHALKVDTKDVGKVYDEWADWISLDKEDFVGMVNFTKENGFLDIGAGVLERDVSSYRPTVNPNSATFGFRTKVLNRASNVSPIIFNTAERINQLTAMAIAVPRMRGKGVKGDLFTGTNRDLLLRSQDTFAHSMTTQSKSIIQQGLWQTPTQFLSYYQRVAETWIKGLTNTTGDIGHLTQGEAFLMPAVFVAYFGVEGTAGSGSFNGIINALGGEDFIKENPAVAKTIRSGMIDGINKVLFDNNSAFGANAGPAAWVRGIREMLTIDSAMDVFAGVGGSTVRELVEPSLDTMANMYYIVTSEVADLKKGEQLGRQFMIGVERTAKNISSWDRASKLLYARKAGRAIDDEYLNLTRKGKQIGTVTRSELLGNLIGLTPDVNATYSSMYLNDKENKQHLRNIADEARIMFRSTVTDPTSFRDFMTKDMAWLTAGMDDDEVNTVVRSVLQKDLLESMFKRMGSLDRAEAQMHIQNYLDKIEKE
jgi:hypothetical protein